jgi:acyl-coenzyme A thioesterase PaaI-like protein
MFGKFVISPLRSAPLSPQVRGEAGWGRLAWRTSKEGAGPRGWIDAGQDPAGRHRCFPARVRLSANFPEPKAAGRVRGQGSRVVEGAIRAVEEGDVDAER